MSRSCILLTTDIKYLFPTLVTAITARKHSDPATADVIVACFGDEHGAMQPFRHAFAAEGVELALHSPAIIEGASPMMARLLLTRFVPAEYEEILYLDGDIIINRSLDPLLGISLPDGGFLAANDPISFIVAKDTREAISHRARMHQFGICGEMMNSYFNSGVLRIRRQGWAETGEKAWEFYCRHKGRSQFPDQDALNYAGWKNRLPMSMKWNFPIFLRNANLDSALEPHVFHFMSSPKPWHGSFSPWNASWHMPYREALVKYPALSPYVDRLSPLRTLKYRLQQRYKHLSELLLWGLSQRKTDILHYESACFPIPHQPAIPETAAA